MSLCILNYKPVYPFISQIQDLKFGMPARILLTQMITCDVDYLENHPAASKYSFSYSTRILNYTRYNPDLLSPSRVIDGAILTKGLYKGAGALELHP